jgi:hypothetical protein
VTVSYSPLSAMVASERIKDLRRQAVRRGRIREALRIRREGAAPADPEQDVPAHLPAPRGAADTHSARRESLPHGGRQ